MSKKKTSGQMTENVNIQGDTEILLMDDDDCELNFDEDTGNGNDNAEFEHEEDTGNDNGDAEFEHEEDDPFTDDDDAEERIQNLNFGELRAVNDLSREMISRMNELRNKYLDYIELKVSEFSDENDDDFVRTEMIATLDKIDVYSCLDRADSIIRLIRTIVDSTTQVG